MPIEPTVNEKPEDVTDVKPTEPTVNEKPEVVTDVKPTGVIAKTLATSAIIIAVLAGNGVQDKFIQDKAIDNYINAKDSIEAVEIASTKNNQIFGGKIPKYSYFQKDSLVEWDETTTVCFNKDPDAKPICHDSLDGDGNPIQIPFAPMAGFEEASKDGFIILQSCVNPDTICVDSILHYSKMKSFTDSIVLPDSVYVKPYDRYAFPDIFDRL